MLGRFLSSVESEEGTMSILYGLHQLNNLSRKTSSAMHARTVKTDAIMITITFVVLSLL